MMESVALREAILNVKARLDTANEILKPLNEIPELVNWRGQRDLEKVRSTSVGTPSVAVGRLAQRPTEEALERARSFLVQAEVALSEVRKNVLDTPQLLEPLELAIECLR
jgi:hypothetical protein